MTLLSNWLQRRRLDRLIDTNREIAVTEFDLGITQLNLVHATGLRAIIGRIIADETEYRLTCLRDRARRLRVKLNSSAVR